MTRLYANPYDLSAVGFYFDSAEAYKEQAEKLRNSYGEPVEEFEIEFIDGELIDAQVAKAWGLNQCNFPAFLSACDEWDEDDKRRLIVAVGEAGYNFDPESDHPEKFEIDIYECDSMRELAEQFVDEGLLGDIPTHLENYIDLDAIARDLSFDYSETCIDGQTLIYRCG